MTREETKKCIEVMQAYVDGKEILVGVKKHDIEGDKVSNPCWDWNTYVYCIKEEPKPFSWRGKNIQWLKNPNTNGIKVISIGDGGIHVNYERDDLIGWGSLLSPTTYWAWSEDNATWRRFE